MQFQMSLITRCPACGTMFKVVADQLKVSQGWVRCGHCSEVFDAATHLQPFAPLLPANTSQDAVAPAEATVDLTVNSVFSVPDASALPAGQEEEKVAASALSPFVPEVEVPVRGDLAADVFAASINPEPADYSAVYPAAHEDRAQLRREDTHFSESETVEENPAEQVSFVRDARRDAFWRRPLMRVVLTSAALFLLAALLLQIAVFQRSTFAVTQPWASSGLQVLCGLLDCEISPPQHIDSVIIDSSSFNKLANDAYRLKVVIRNTGAIPLAMPSLELTLTDTQDHALVRRVMTPAELGARASTLAGGAEFFGELTLTLQNPATAASAAAASPASASSPDAVSLLRIAGYRILAFYP
jgi:predicted Zn finger-like uncharacterized protein